MKSAKVVLLSVLSSFLHSICHGWPVLDLGCLLLAGPLFSSSLGLDLLCRWAIYAGLRVFIRKLQVDLSFSLSLFLCFLFVCVYCSVCCVRRSYGCGWWQISEFVWFLLVLAGSSGWILVVHICLFMLMETNGGVLRLDFSSSRLCLLCLLVRDMCFFLSCLYLARVGILSL